MLFIKYIYISYSSMLKPTLRLSEMRQFDHIDAILPFYIGNALRKCN